jgi:hypothetical protein
MTHTTPLMPARLAFAGLLTVLAAAIPASALLGLPVAVPAIGQHVDTPLGTIDANASEDGASACADLATPALPAIPALPLPVAVPQVPDVGAASNDCVSAGLDGAHANLGAQAAGTSAQAGADVDTSQAHQAAEETVHHSGGFLQDLIDSVMSWF